MSHRLFVGLRPPAAARAALLGLMGGVPGARWQTDAQLHATIAFAGEVNRHQADAIALSLRHLRSPRLLLDFGPFGTFQTPRGQVATLWIGLRPEPAIADLAAQVGRLLAGAGIALPSRRFVPHVTLARFPPRGVPPESLLRFLADRRPPSETFSVDSVILFESFLGHGGAHYEAILETPLEPPGARLRGSSAGPRPPSPEPTTGG